MIATGDRLLTRLIEVDSQLWRGVRDDMPPGPYNLSVGGREWAIATDGHLLVAVERERIPNALMECPPKVLQVAEKYIGMEAEGAQSIEAWKLKRFAGVGKEQEPCSTCNDKRRVECETCEGSANVECTCDCGHEHDATCDDCDGRGDHACEDCQPSEYDRPGVLRGLIINRRLLHRLLTTIEPSDDAMVAVSTTMTGYGSVGADMFVLHGDWWRAVIMAMRGPALEPTVSFDDA